MPTDTRPYCQGCGDLRVAPDDFLCRFCFVKLPQYLKRDLRLSIGRSDEKHVKEKAVQWLKDNRNRRNLSGTSHRNGSSTRRR